MLSVVTAGAAHYARADPLAWDRWRVKKKKQLQQLLLISIYTKRDIGTKWRSRKSDEPILKKKPIFHDRVKNHSSIVSAFRTVRTF